MKNKWLNDKQIDEIFSKEKKSKDGYWALAITIAYIAAKHIIYYSIFAIFSTVAFSINKDITTEFLNQNFSPVIKLFTDIVLGLLLVIFIIKFFKGRNLFKGGLKTPSWTKGSTLSLIVGFSLGIILSGFWVYQILNIQESAVFQSTAFDIGVLLERISFSLRSLISPFIEELLFRGFLFGYLNLTFGFKSSFLITTGLFVFPHYFDRNFDLFNFVALTSIALTTLFVRIKFKSIGSPIILHLTHNIIVIITIMNIWSKA